MKENPDWGKKHAPPEGDYQKEEASTLEIGQRCQTADVNKWKGEIKYIGKVSGMGNGYWVGLQLDDALGNSDGKKNGQEYFTCPENYGLFLRPKEIEVGEYKKEEEFDMDEDMI